MPYIQDEIWYVLSSQLSIENDTDMYIACEMKRDFVEDFRKRQEDKVSFYYEGKNKIVTWLTKFTWNDAK